MLELQQDNEQIKIIFASAQKRTITSLGLVNAVFSIVPLIKWGRLWEGTPCSEVFTEMVLNFCCCCWDCWIWFCWCCNCAWLCKWCCCACCCCCCCWWWWWWWDCCNDCKCCCCGFSSFIWPFRVAFLCFLYLTCNTEIFCYFVHLYALFAVFQTPG